MYASKGRKLFDQTRLEWRARVYSAIHRFSPRPLVSLAIPGVPTPTDPVPGPGDLVIVTDTQGRLRALENHSWPTERRADVGPPNWDLLFRLAGLESSLFRPVRPTRLPGVFADTRAAWIGRWPDGSGLPVRLEAAALGERPVFFLALHQGLAMR